MMTSVTPREMVPITDTWRTMLSKLSCDMNTGDRKLMAITMTTNTM